MGRAKKQVETTKKKYGKEFYKEIGSIGGNSTPSQFDKETGRRAAILRWQRYYENKRRKEEVNGES